MRMPGILRRRCSSSLAQPRLGWELWTESRSRAGRHFYSQDRPLRQDHWHVRWQPRSGRTYPEPRESAATRGRTRRIYKRIRHHRTRAAIGGKSRSALRHGESRPCRDQRFYNSPVDPAAAKPDVGNGFLEDNGYTMVSAHWEEGQGIHLPSFTGEDGHAVPLRAVGFAAIRT